MRLPTALSLAAALVAAAPGPAAEPAPTAPCPPACVCFRSTVRCMHHHLETVPSVPRNTTVLDLRFNKIKRIRRGDFNNLNHLHTLLINDNHIHRLENGVFDGLSELRILFLHKNRIHEIEEGAFDGLPRLVQLYLHFNRIKKLQPHLFEKLQKLERLFLQENNIKRIEPYTFKGMTSLKRLRLDGNALVCDCNILWLKNMSEEADMQVAATCHQPPSMKGKTLKEMPAHHFHCSGARLLETPQNTSVAPGETAVLRCSAEGDPPLSLFWLRNSEQLETKESDKYEQTPDGWLKVKDVQETAEYQCVASSPYGVVFSLPVTLRPTKHRGEESLWRRRPEDQTARLGETVQLECAAAGGRATWSRGGVSLVTGPRRQISPEGTLTLLTLSTQDAGPYTCTIGTLSATALLTVNARPRLVDGPESVAVGEGGTVEVRCEASGQPLPIISWYRDGTSLVSGPRIRLDHNGTRLRVHEATSADSGLYTCVAQNSEGLAEGSAEVRVRGVGLPLLTSTPFPLTAALGSSVELPCSARGRPPPLLTWLHNGLPVTLDSRRKLFPAGGLRIYKLRVTDAGEYTCLATNSFGNVSAHALLRVTGALSGVDDSLVVEAVEEARRSVDQAVNSTLEKMLHNKANRTPGSLVRLIRYPDPETRTYVRAADIFEKALINIRKRITDGMKLNETEEFSYSDLLSEEQVALVSQLSGCTEHQHKPNCTDLGFHTKYRTIDGTCNNLQHPHWGASFTPFRRLLPPAYEDRFTTPQGWSKKAIYFGFPKPSARSVSTTVIRTEETTQDDRITHMVMQWGQFLDHDLDHAIPSTTAESWEGLDCKKTCEYSPPCFPMEVPRGDPRIQNRRCMDFIRSSAVCGSGATSFFFDKIHPREQINQLTPFIDGTQVYGFSTNRSNILRDFSNKLGLLRRGVRLSSGNYLLPLAGAQEVDCRRDPSESDLGCFLAGDIRANEQAGLLAMHTIWMREHNRVALELHQVNKHWHGDQLFEEARKVVGATMQHITYHHWLPNILGPKGMAMLGPYEGYNPNLDPSISNSFATAALRFGHSMINPVLTRLDHDFKTIPQGNLSLGDAFFSPWRMAEEGGVDPLLRGLLTTPAKVKRPQQSLTSQLTERLFAAGHAVPLDLAAMNVQRGRDHGLPSYEQYRRLCGLPPVHSFQQLQTYISDPTIRDRLQQLYGHPGNIDLWVGGILEDTVEGAKVGPTFLCILVEQFKRIRDADRFWYENPSSFKPAQLTQLKQASLARILCDNGDNITRVTEDVFLLPDKQPHGLVNCDSIPHVDLKFWYECEECEGLAGAVARLERAVAVLRRRVRRLTGPCAHPSSDGLSWPKDKCTLCHCQETKVSCSKLTCPVLNCNTTVHLEDKCCPHCLT